MQIDKVTFNDISIFHVEEEFSIFHKLNFTNTVGGKEYLRRFFTEPHKDIKRIIGVQKILKSFQHHLNDWPTEVTNGTLIMMDKFLDYQLDPVPGNPNRVNSFTYRWLHATDFSMIKFSVKHFMDFFRGVNKIREFLKALELPANLQIYVDRMEKIMQERPLLELAEVKSEATLTRTRYLYFAYYLRNDYRSELFELIDIFSRFEAYYSMARAVEVFQLHFPQFIETTEPVFEATKLYHVLLEHPTSYDLELRKDQNFMFLTGANMAGKSTLIKSVGSAVFLAHIGMGVPADSMRLSLFDGLLTNINVSDNIARGESYFYNEVQRIKNTIQKINNEQKWLVLIDELFKGTNVQDAMRCSLSVIRGLIRIRGSLFILSTHLYEIGEELKSYPNISFRYFETRVENDELSFPYVLREGISNDRIGYVILRREGVVDMLERL